MMNDTNDSLLKCAGTTRFHTILCDAPWPSKSSPGRRDHWMKTNMKPRYGTMTVKEIMDLPVNAIAAPDAVLVMWATWMHLALAMRTIDVWGFTYCAGFPWLKVVKTGMEHLTNPNNIEISDIPLPGLKKKFKLIPAPIYGPGVWFQGCTELILIGRRGHPFGSQGNPRPARKGLIVAPRQEHSAKPEELRRWIDEKLPGPKLEMFARKRYPGWISWGDEV